MFSPNPSRRHLRSALSLSVGLLLLAGCAPTPTPTPTPTPAFASEEEAFAAAEATYREYTDALNQVDFAEPRTFELVYDQLSGDAAESTRSSFSDFHADGVRTTGATTFDAFVGQSVDLIPGVVQASVCVDVSGVSVFDATGQSLVSTDRPPRQPMSVTFVVVGRDARLTISQLRASGDFSCAG